MRGLKYTARKEAGIAEEGRTSLEVRGLKYSLGEVHNDPNTRSRTSLEVRGLKCHVFPQYVVALYCRTSLEVRGLKCGPY